MSSRSSIVSPRDLQAVVEVHELARTDGERRLNHGARVPPVLVRRHLLEQVVHPPLLVLLVRRVLQLVDGLQQLRLLLQEVLQRAALLLRRHPRVVLDLPRFLQAPRLELVVQRVEVFRGARVRPPLDLPLPQPLVLTAPPLLLRLQLLLHLLLLLPQLARVLAREPAARVALNIDALLDPQLMQLGRGEVLACGEDTVPVGVDVQPWPRHLRGALAHRLHRAPRTLR